MPAAKLHQIGFNYDVEHDRILMRIKMDDLSEVRAWITRHYLKHLWLILMKGMSHYASKYKNNPSKEAIMAFEHEEKVSKADLKQKFTQEVTDTPLGAAPLLLYGIQLKPGPGALQTIGFFPKNGKGIELALDETLFHVLCKLLIDCHRVAEWSLNLNIPGAEQLIAPSGSH